MPDVPWAAIAGLRNVVVHEYFRVNPDLILDIVDDRLALVGDPAGPACTGTGARAFREVAQGFRGVPTRALNRRGDVCAESWAVDHASDERKARYAFVHGDLRRLHRTGLIACVYRASEWRHKESELAAHDLLQELDSATAPPRG